MTSPSANAILLGQELGKYFLGPSELRLQDIGSSCRVATVLFFLPSPSSPPSSLPTIFIEGSSVSDAILGVGLGWGVMVTSAPHGIYRLGQTDYKTCKQTNQ